MTKQYITRKGSFDSMHRVMNERFKCFNLHGHTYLYELTFEFSEPEKIGYAIDFKEIKRIGCQFIDDYFDHGAILNPKDLKTIQLSKDLGSKFWIMSLNGRDEYCNPSVENIAKEIFLAIDCLFQSFKNLRLHKITIYETPNCYTDCFENSVTELEKQNFLSKNLTVLEQYSTEKGIINYFDEEKI